MKLIDFIKAWDRVTIEKRKNDDFPVYYKQAEELRAAVGNGPTIVWFSGSNGPFFGSGSFLAIDDTDEVIAEICCLIE